MITKKSYSKLFTFQKYLGIVMSIFGVLVLFFDRNPGASVPLMVGLFMLFTAPEKVEDERSISLKTSSLYLAFILGYAFKLLSSNLYSHGLFPLQLTEINHFIILVFFIALISYYFRLYAYK